MTPRGVDDASREGFSTRLAREAESLSVRWKGECGYTGREGKAGYKTVDTHHGEGHKTRCRGSTRGRGSRELRRNARGRGSRRHGGCSPCVEKATSRGRGSRTANTTLLRVVETEMYQSTGSYRLSGVRRYSVPSYIPAPLGRSRCASFMTPIQFVPTLIYGLATHLMPFSTPAFHQFLSRCPLSPVPISPTLP